MAEINKNNIEENNDSNENNDFQQVSRSTIPTKTIKNRLYNGAKKAGNLAKSLISTGKRIFSNIARWIVTNPKLVLILAIIIGLIILICVIVSLFTKEETNQTISDSANTVIDSWDPDNLTTEQQLASETYEKTGSLLDFTVSDIKQMVSEVEKKNDLSSLSSDEKYLYSLYLEKIGDNDVEGDRIVSPNDKVSLFEHMLLISKYDFNNVKWKQYAHGIDGADSPMIEDNKMGVRYPSDQNSTSYDTFSSLLRPYLISYEIPTAFFSGLFSDNNFDMNTTQLFTYGIIKNGLSDIVVNRYDVQLYNLATYYRIYDYNRFYSSFSVTFTPVKEKGKITGYSISYSSVSQNQSGNTETKNTRENNGVEDVMLEEIIPESTFTDIDNKYYISEANIFDLKISNTYNYIPYSEEDSNNRVNADSMDVTEELYSEIVNEENKIEDVNGKIYSCGTDIDSAISSISASNNVSSTSRENNDDGSIIVKFNCSEYEDRNGTTYYVNRTWSDKLTQQGRKEEKYTTDDVISYNENHNQEKITSEQFKSDTNSLEYYNELSEAERINRIDIFNSNPSIFNEYIDTSYMKYVGISRPVFDEFCYDNLVSNFNDLIDKYKTFPYIYGKTLGFGNSSAGGSTSTSTGISLLMEYLHAWEGTPPESADGTKYVIFDDGYENLTVGYGVTIEYYGSKMREAGATDLSLGAEVDKEIVDKIEKDIVQSKIDVVKSRTSELDLKEYQIHALVVRLYNYPAGLDGNGNNSPMNFVESYKAYWNEETDDQYEERNNVPNLNHKLYTEFLSTPITSRGEVSEGLINRRKSEFTLFQTGYYDRIDKWWSPVSSGNIEGIDLYNADGTVNEEQIKNLQTAIEQRLNLVEGDNNLSGSGTAVSYSDRCNVIGDFYGSAGGDRNQKGLQIYQCTWWANSRASEYLYNKDPEKYPNGYPTAMGNGGDYYDYNKWFNTGTEPKPNSIGSYRNGRYGHVFYVEAVDYENGYYYVSHAGSGNYWFGIQKVKIASTWNGGSIQLNPFIYLDEPLE